MNVVCLIADIIDSRDIVDRGAFQKRLKAELDDINVSSRTGLLSPYTITLGDEFQAVYRGFSSVFVDAARIMWMAYPYKLRFAVARGRLSTEMNVREALGMDGPAFYAARARLESLKKYKRAILAVDVGDAVGGDGAAGRRYVDLVNGGLVMFSNEAERWNRTSLGCFVGLMLGKSIKEIVVDTEVKERMVYKAIANGRIKDYVDYFAALTESLQGEAI